MSTQVRVALMYDDEAPQDKYFRVTVCSKVKKNIMNHALIHVDSHHIDKAIMIGAGAAAEEQNEKYGDRHDPDECAKAALEAYLECKAKAAEGNYGRTQAQT